MTRAIFRLFGFVVLSVGFLPTAFAQTAIPWQTNLDSARAMAAQTNRPILVHFWSESCGPCRWMEREVFPRPEVAAAIQANYVPVKVNDQENPRISQQFGVTGLPTDIILAPNGREITRSEGALAASQYVGRLNQIAAGVRTESMKSVAQIPGAPAGGNERAQGPVPSRGASAYSEARPAPAVAEQRSANLTLPNVQLPTMPPANSAPPTPNFAPPTSVANQAPVTASNGAAPQGYSVPPWKQGELAPRSAVASPVPQAVAVASQAPTSPQPPMPKPRSADLPPGSPPLALDGFCAVQLLDANQWVKGDRRYGVIHRGKTYLFSGPEQAKRFYADPDRYSPVLAGNDVVLAIDQGLAVPGNRNVGARYGERIYLFSSEASYQKFYRDPSRYSSAAQGVVKTAMRSVDRAGDWSDDDSSGSSGRPSLFRRVNRRY